MAAKPRVFGSFDFDRDHDIKGSLFAQAKRPDSPFSLVDVSLKEAYPSDKWLEHAKSAISKCDLFIVLLGEHTHRAAGVLQEVKIAKDMKKRRFQLRRQGSNAKRVPEAGPIVNWTWPKLHSAIYG